MKRKKKKIVTANNYKFKCKYIEYIIVHTSRFFFLTVNTYQEKVGVYVASSRLILDTPLRLSGPRTYANLPIFGQEMKYLGIQTF